MQMYGIILFASELEIKHMIDGLGEIIPYFVCLHVTKNLVIAFFSQSQLGQKGSKYYSNLVLFVYFQFLLESMSYYSFCNVLRTRKLAFIPYTQPIITSMRSFICLVQLYFLP